MSKYRKKPVVVEAHQWFKNGDHPDDGDPKREGAVVRYYRTPELNGQKQCEHCKVIMHYHGWVDTLEAGHVVCPTSWIITGVEGEIYPCKDNIFKKTYEKVEGSSGE